MPLIRIKNFLCVILCLLFMNLSSIGKDDFKITTIEDFFANFRSAVESQNLESISSFYDQTQTDFLNKEISRWKNIISTVAAEDLGIKYYSLGGDDSKQFIIFDISSPNPLFNLVFSNTFTSHPYIIRKNIDGWKFFGNTQLSKFYIPIEEEISVKVNPSNHEIHMMHTLKLETGEDDVPALIFLLSDELKTESCNERGRSLNFEQFGYLLYIDRPVRKSEREITLTVKYSGRIEKYKKWNNHYIKDNGGILRSENFWHLSTSSYEEFLPRPIKLTINLPKNYYAVSDSGHLASSENVESRLVQRWDIPPEDSQSLGFIFYNGWLIDTYKTKVNNILFCFDKESKLDKEKIVAKTVDIIETYQEMFGRIPIRNFYFLDYNFGFIRKNYVPADMNILSHELAHLWWGFPGELWLNEGFAEYSKCLYLERSKGPSEFLQRLGSLKKNVIRTIEDGLDLPLVGSGYHTLLYSKGALVVHALRIELGDSLFFKTIKNFLAKYHNKNPTWKDFRTIAETTSGRDLEYFFEQWLLHSGLPQLEFNYEVIKDGELFRVQGKVTQAKLFYRIPSELVISGNNKEEKHKFIIDKSEVSFTFLVSFKPEVVDLYINEGIPYILKGSGPSAIKSNLEAEGIKTLEAHDYERAVESFRELLNLITEENEVAMTNFRMGKAFFGLGKYSEAVKQFNKALNFSDLPANYRNVSMLYLGKSMLCEGKKEKAKEFFNQIIDAPDAHEYYKTVASRYIQYSGSIKTPQHEVIRFIEDLQKAVNEKNEATLKSLSQTLEKEKQSHILSLEKLPISDFRLKLELVLDAGDGKYHLECFASGMFGKQKISGDFILLVQQIEKEIKLIDVIRIEMR